MQITLSAEDRTAPAQRLSKLLAWTGLKPSFDSHVYHVLSRPQTCCPFPSEKFSSQNECSGIVKQLSPTLGIQAGRRIRRARTKRAIATASSTELIRALYI